MEEYLTKSGEETKNLAKKLAKDLTGVIGLVGQLGAGKTTFVQGFAQELGIRDKILSPTFVLIRVHPIPKSKKVLYHVDLYRLDHPKEFNNIGISEILTDDNNIVLIEWAEKIKDLLPKDTIWIYFETVGESRRISITKEPT